MKFEACCLDVVNCNPLTRLAMSSIEDPPQLEDPDIKKEKDGVIQNGQGTKLTDQYLSASDGFANQDPDELMTNEKNSKELKDIEDGNLQDASGGVKKTENHELDATKQPPDLFTGAFQEESASVQHLDRPHEEADVYLSDPHATLSAHMKDEENIAASSERANSELNEAAPQESSLSLTHEEPKSNLHEDGEMQIISEAVMTSQEAQSSSDASAVTMQAIDNQGQLYQQQPTYVLLQTTGDQDGSGQPQVYLAMQTGGVAGQESQAYITLHPVSVEGQDISGTFSTEGLNLQQAVLSQSDISGDVSLELNPHVSLADVKGLHLTAGIDASSQMYIPATGQIVTATDSDPSGNGVITYIQSVNSVNGAGQTQVLMAVAEDDSPQMGNAVRIRAKEAAAIAGNLLGMNPSDSGRGGAVGQVQKQATQNVTTQSRRRLSNDPRTCEECGRSFKYPSDLKKHLQIHTDMKKFQCTECYRCFRRLHQLNVHKRIHSGEKPYVCNRCGAQFRHDSTLTMHIRTRHDHLKPFSCEGCGKNFGRMSHLRKHQRNVCGKGAPKSSMITCKYCNEAFARKSDLRQHFIACDKKPDKPEKDMLTPNLFSCDHCGKEFSRNYDFKRHQLSHTDEKPFSCSKCAKNFKEKSSLYKHVKRMHAPLTGEGYLDVPQDEATEAENTQRAIATITSSTDGIVAPATHDIIVSLAQSISSSSDNETIATAHALAQAGIIDNADQILQGGHTIAAADILNFPEVAAALGLNPGSQSGSHTMVVTQPVHTATIIGMDTDHVRIQESGLDDDITSSEVSSIKQFDSATSSLQLDSEGLMIDTGESSLNPDDPIIDPEQPHLPQPATGSIQVTTEADGAMTSSANNVAVVNITPSVHRTNISISNVLTGADAERVAASVGSVPLAYEADPTAGETEPTRKEKDEIERRSDDEVENETEELAMSID